MTSSSKMEDEFDVWATWTADAVEELGPAHALPAGCRGSGSPAALEWLAVSMGLRAGARFLDAGAGIGGPAELLRRRFRVVPTLIDPMPGACLASARLFDRPGVVADGSALPLRDRSVDHAWSLGVLCTVPDKATHVTELVRVLARHGSLGLLVFVRTVDVLPTEPEGNSFPTKDDVEGLLLDAGLRIDAEAELGTFPPPPSSWSGAVDDVERLIRRDHGDTAAWQRSRDQSSTIGDLMDDGLVVGRLWVCRPR